jgi:hypothetical protein
MVRKEVFPGLLSRIPEYSPFIPMSLAAGFYAGGPVYLRGLFLRRAFL